MLCLLLLSEPFLLLRLLHALRQDRPLRLLPLLCALHLVHRRGPSRRRGNVGGGRGGRCGVARAVVECAGNGGDDGGALQADTPAQRLLEVDAVARAQVVRGVEERADGEQRA